MPVNYTDTTALTDAERAQLLAIAGGDYQRRLLLGEQGWCSFGIEGGARRWGASYRTSRRQLLDALARCGFNVQLVDAPDQINTRAIITRA